MPRRKTHQREPKSAAPTSTCPTSDNFRRLKPYAGKDQKLVLSIDIGTTFSAASYCILSPRLVPILEIVSSWPGQTVDFDFKIPSVIYYDHSGKPKAWGAETLDPDVRAQASDENWTLVEWFKLSLRPPHLQTQCSIPPLPTFVTVHRVYADFLKFMLDHISIFFCKNQSSGSEVWRRLFPTIEVVFTIPSGWEMRQQFDLRNAAVDAGYMGSFDWSVQNASSETIDGVKSTKRETLLNEAMQRIIFVSEAEAAMIYAAHSGHIDTWLKPGQNVILCDAGGGTIDTTAYTIVKTSQLQLKEISAPKCIIAGAVLVNRCAEKYIHHKIFGARWAKTPSIGELMDVFERDLKKRFHDPWSEYGWGSGLDNNFHATENGNGLDIRNGRLYIPGKDLELFFKPTLNAIKRELSDIHKLSKGKTKSVVMVGGFMNSRYAYNHLEEWGQEKGIEFAKPDGTLAKAVPHGALLWYLTKPVRGYILKFHYGIEASLELCDIPDNTDLIDKQIITEMDGKGLVDGGWSTIASKGEELNPRDEFIADYQRYIEWGEAAESYRFEEKVYLCRSNEPPTFLTIGSNPNIEHVCSIVVDLERLFLSTPWEFNKNNGKMFKNLEFLMSIRHNGYELDAYAYSIVEGKKIIGDAKVVLSDISGVASSKTLMEVKNPWGSILGLLAP